MDFQSLLNHYREIVEAGIGEYLPPREERPSKLHTAMSYSMESGGKRLRPILVMAGHALIHDDLPCIDNSDLRRGRPTCHLEYGEATAVLAGDALLTHAFFLLADAYRSTPGIAALLCRDLAEAAGSRRLIGGQMEDITTGGDTNDTARLEYIHENKTAALVTASLKMGVRLSDPQEGDIEHAAETGRMLGLAYQLVDDILDATGDSASLGKSTGQDVKNETMSAVRVLGLEEARRRVGILTGKAVSACHQLKGDTRFLVSLVKTLEHRVR
jgi:geranylgeranyl diphosphate synthase type II